MIVKKVVFAIGHFFGDIGRAFKYNPSIIAGLFIAVPGILIGLFINIHYYVSTQVLTATADIHEYWATLGVTLTQPVENDFSSAVLFIMMIAGCLNIFTAVNTANKKNLGSAVTSLILTIIIIITGSMWARYIYNTNFYANNSPISGGLSYWPGKEGFDLLTFSNEAAGTNLGIKSLFCVYASMVSSAIGTVLAFIYRNKFYKKEKF